MEAIDASRFAPMAGGIYTPQFIIVSDPGKIHKLAQCAQQPFISKAQYIVVVISNPKMPTNAYGKQGDAYCRQQAGAAIQNFLLKLTEAGLSTCWIGHFVESMVKTELRIPNGIRVEAFFPIGYEFKKVSRVRPKIDLGKILHFDNYGRRQMSPDRRIEV